MLQTDMEKAGTTGTMVPQKFQFPAKSLDVHAKNVKFAEMNKIADDSIHKRCNFIVILDSR